MDMFRHEHIHFSFREESFQFHQKDIFIVSENFLGYEKLFTIFDAQCERDYTNALVEFGRQSVFTFANFLFHPDY